jgi:S1-C subfamily serine protease
LPVGHGVLVTKIAEGSPADSTGLKEGDIILEIDNVETAKIEDLVKEIRKRKVGDIVRIFLIRNSREHYFELRLRSMP